MTGSHDPDPNIRGKFTPVVVIRDREPAALENPGQAAFGRRATVRHLHLSSVTDLPDARCLVFNLVRLDPATRALVLDGATAGTRVLLILEELDDDAAALAAHPHISVIPAYGPGAPIGERTMKRAVQLFCRGTKLVADGALRNSITPATAAHADSTFLRCIARASAEARAGASVVAATLALHRTGSQFIRDLVGWTTGSQVRVVHEHGVPEEAATAAVAPDRHPFDAWALAATQADRLAIRHGLGRHALLTADRALVVTTYREPVSRLTSYFLKRHSGWLRAQPLSEDGRFQAPEIIQRHFTDWLADQAVREKAWYRATLRRRFGLDICRTERTRDGLFLTEAGPRTLLVIPTAQIDTVIGQVEAAFGSGCTRALSSNSTTFRGDGELATAFRAQITFPAEIAATLRALPEARHLH